MKYELDLVRRGRSEPPALERACLCPRPRVSKVMGRIGLYRHVWHPALFDFAVYVCIVTSLVFASKEFFS